MSDRPGPEEAASEASLTLRLSMLISRRLLGTAVMDDASRDEVLAASAGDLLSSRASGAPMFCPAEVRIGADCDCTRWSFSFRLYRSFSFIDLSRSLFNPKIIALCFSTNLHSCALCEAAWFFSPISFCTAASGEPAAEINAATSSGAEPSCAPRYALLLCGFCELAVAVEIEDAVESMEAVRGMMGFPSTPLRPLRWCCDGRGVAVVEVTAEEGMVGEDCGEDCGRAEGMTVAVAVAVGAVTGAVTSRDRVCVAAALAAFFASSLSTSRATACRNSSIAGLVGTRLAGLGVRTRCCCCCCCCSPGEALPGAAEFVAVDVVGTCS